MRQAQKTISRDISIEGVGVHTGKHSVVKIHPATPDSGIIILNKFLPDEPIHVGKIIPEQTMHATVLKSKSWGVSTIEHLIAAIVGLEIDNVLIEISGIEAQRIEIPIIDGSALPFVQAIKKVGIKEQEKQKKFITPKKPIFFEENNRFLQIEPQAKPATPDPKNLFLKIDYSVEFEHPLVKNKSFSETISPDFFSTQIAPARTFGFLEQLPILRKHGLANGATLGNTVVVGEDSFLNTLRFEDEFIRHKILDLIGDLGLLGKNLVGTIKAHKTGHNFNRLVIEHFINRPEEWQIL